MNWNDIGRENLRAARLLHDRHARSAASRAYYACHAVLAQALIDAGYRLPINRQTPPHHQQAGLIGSHLAGRGPNFVRQLRAAMRRLYRTRLDSDYNRRLTIDKRVSLQALRDAYRTFKLLEVLAMTVVIDAAERDRIANLAEAALERHQPRGYRIEVDRTSILHEDDWFHVLVKTPGELRTYDFYDALAEAEAELQDQQGLHILLVPVEGD